MSLPIGSISLTTEFKENDFICESSAFQRGFHIFTPATEPDIKHKSNKGRVFFKLNFDFTIEQIDKIVEQIKLEPPF